MCLDSLFLIEKRRSNLIENLLGLIDLFLDPGVQLLIYFVLQVLVNYARSSKEAEEVSKEVEYKSSFKILCEYLSVCGCHLLCHIAFVLISYWDRDYDLLIKQKYENPLQLFIFFIDNNT